MAKRLPVPAELQHLIEKREQDERRKTKARATPDRRTLELGPGGALEGLQDVDDCPVDDRRIEASRRKKKDRREKTRRKKSL